jgi:hypothetical protein
MIKRDQVLYGPLAGARQHPHAWASQQGEYATRITRQPLAASAAEDLATTISLFQRRPQIKIKLN